MTRFRFRPDALLELRRRLLDAATIATQAADRAAAEAQSTLDAACAQLDAGARAYRSVVHDGTPAGEAEWHRAWIAHLQRESKRLGAVSEERVEAVSVAREQLRVAHQRVRALERLRARALRQHVHEEDRREAKTIDQLAVQQHARRSIDGATD